MINPNENDLTRDEPLPTQLQPRGEEIGSTGREQFRQVTNKFSTAMSQTWDQTKEKAGRARERTEYFVRENPVPAILSALGIGIAIGLAIRYASPIERKTEVEVKSPLGDLNWSVLSLPFLWPLFKSAREKYESSAEAVKDGVKRLKKIDVNRLESLDALSPLQIYPSARKPLMRSASGLGYWAMKACPPPGN